MTRAVGVIEEKIYEQRLALVDVHTGVVRQITPANMYIYEYDWAPDGKSFAAIAAKALGTATGGSRSCTRWMRPAAR